MIIGISGKKGSGKDTVCKIIQAVFLAEKYAKQDIDILADKEGFIQDLVKANITYRGRTGADLLANESGWQKKMFAYKLKQIVCILTGCTMEDLENEEFKSKELGEKWWYYKIGAKSIYPRGYFKGEDEIIAEKRYLVKPTYRLLLQQIGTELGRNIIHPNTWVNSLMNEYKGICQRTKSIDKCNICYNGQEENQCRILPNWCITDVRFPNEAETIKEKGGLLFRIERPNLDEQEPCILCNKSIREQIKGCSQISCYRQYLKKDNHPSETALDNYNQFNDYIRNDGTIEDLIAEVRSLLEVHKII